jgi:hypothetical protein
MKRPIFLMHEGTSDGRITKGDNYEHTFLSEPVGIYIHAEKHLFHTFLYEEFH